MLKLAIVLLLLFETCVFAQKLPTETAGIQNGRSWRHMSETSKGYYLSGIADGQNAMSIALYAALKGEDWSKHLETTLLDLLRQSFPKLSVGEVINELDVFFSDGANAPIRIYDALAWLTAKAGGATRENLDDLVAALRKKASVDPGVRQ